MNKIYKLAVALCLMYGSISAQDTLLKGRIVDEEGAGVPLAVIMLDGTSLATETNDSGYFELNIPQDSTKKLSDYYLMISSGEANKLKVNAGADLSAVLYKTKTTTLKEVLLIGYGSQDKTENTGSIAKVEGKDIANLPVTSYEQAIQGRMSGVQIGSTGGEIASKMNIRVRGAASLTASNQPLVVIDGFIVTSEDQGNFTDNNASNPMADLNPNDIESVEVLKDAAAAAIYGARGANGVILITTKRGKGDTKTQFTVNFSTGWSKAAHVRKFLNRSQYIEMFTEAAKNAGYTTDEAGLDAAWGDYGGGPYSGAGSFSDLVSRGTDSDWQKSAFQTGHFNQYDLSAKGGSQKTKFYTSLGYMKQDGIIIRNNMQRLSYRFNLDNNVNKYVTWGMSTNFVYNLRNNTPENNQFNSPLEANALAPIISIKDRTGEYNDSTFYANPFRATYNTIDRTTQLRNFSNGYLSINFLKDFTFRSEVGLDYLGLYEYGWNGSKFPTSAGTPNFGKYGTSKVLNYSTNNTVTYLKTIAKKHKIQALLGQSFQKSDFEYSFIQGQGLPNDNLKYLTSASQNTSFSSSATSYAYESFFGRLNYSFVGTYLLGVSMRNDGSSRFGANKQYGWFPAISAGYIISNTDYFRKSGLGKYIDLLKIKTSYGKTGNSEIANFASRGLYSTSYYGSTGGLYPTQLANSNLSWEKNSQWDAGLELSIFKSRISASVDYFNKLTKDMLLSMPVPSTSGYASTLRNVGKMENKGWEISVNTKNIDKEFKWSTSLNISFYKNKVLDLNGQSILPTGGRALNAAIENMPLGAFYGVQYAGVDPESGDALYYLADGTKTSSWSKANQAANYKYLGNPNPKHFGGITNSFEYKGIGLMIFGQWSYGNQIYHASGIFQSSGFTNFGLDNQTVEMMSYWKSPGQVTNVPRPQLDMNNGARASSRYLSDGSYFRFKTITISYTLPEKMVKKAKFNMVKVYVTGQNFFTITKYKGNDPEVGYVAPTASVQTNNLNIGNDYYSAPLPKTIIVGVQLGF
ncbi:MAG: SusC/RagA family TonB-linked outer membrane protein [Cytophagales bacterium]